MILRHKHRNDFNGMMIFHYLFKHESHVCWSQLISSRQFMTNNDLRKQKNYSNFSYNIENLNGVIDREHLNSVANKNLAFKTIQFLLIPDLLDSSSSCSITNNSLRSKLTIQLSSIHFSLQYRIKCTQFESTVSTIKSLSCFS